MGSDTGSEKILAQSFPDLSLEECGKLFPYFEFRTFRQDSAVMGQGDVGDFMGIVLEGKLAIKKETVYPGKFTLIAILERGAMVGEISMAEETIRTATAIAMEDSSLLVLSHDQALGLFKDHPLMGIKILKRIIKVVGGRLQLASARLAQLL